MAMQVYAGQCMSMQVYAGQCMSIQVYAGQCMSMQVCAGQCMSMLVGDQTKRKLNGHLELAMTCIDLHLCFAKALMQDWTQA